MDVLVPDPTGAQLGWLRRRLQRELEGLVAKREGLEKDLQELCEEIDSKQHALELVEATEMQLAEQERAHSDLKGSSSGAASSTQVRVSARMVPLFV
jgi:seryl-tRNA synthetase